MKSNLTQTLLAPTLLALLCCSADLAGAASIGTPLLDTNAVTQDLSALGTLDWELYGASGDITPSQSKLGGSSITLTRVITSPATGDSASRSSATYSWSDGTPATSGSDVNPTDNGFSYSVATVANYYDSYETVTFAPGDTKPHTVHIFYYLGGASSGVSFQFSNSLAGASSVVATHAGPAIGAYKYSVDFQADNPSDVFTVVFTFQKTGGTGSAKRIGINATAIYVAPPPNLSWQGDVNSAWDIATTANWTNSSGTAVNYTETAGVGDSGVTFDDTAVNYLVNVTTAVHPLSILVNNSANDYVISNSAGAFIGGAGALTKQGTSRLTLFGAGNEFSGGVDLKAGTLRLGASESIPDGAGKGGLTMSTNSTLDLNGRNETINSLSGGGTIDNVAGGGSSVLTVGSNNASGAFSGVIQNSSGTVSLVKIGTNSLTLSGTNNTFAGGVTLNAGRLNLNNAGALGTGPLTIAASDVQLGNTSGGAVTLTTTNNQNWNADFTFAGNNNLNTGPGAVTMNASRTVTVSANSLIVGGPIAGSGFGLIKSGTGTLQINSSNTFNGPIVINAGALQLSTAHLGGGVISLADGANLQVTKSLSGSTLNTPTISFGTTSANTNTLTLAFGTNANPATALVTATTLTTANSVRVNITGSGLTQGQFPLISYSGSIGGAGYAAFQLGTLPATMVAELSNNVANQSVDLVITDYPGTPKIWVGDVDSNWDIDTTSNWLDSVFLVSAPYSETSISGNSVTFNDTASNSTVNIVAPVKPASITVNNTNLNYTIGGAAITAGSFTKQGASNLTLTAVNTFTNNFSLQGGTVYLGANGALGAGQVNLSGGALSSDGATARSVTNALLVTADSTFGDGGAGTGNLTFSGPVNWNGGTRTLNARADVLLSGGSSNGSMDKSGSNTLTLEGIHNMSGGTFFVNNGTLWLHNAWLTNDFTQVRMNINQTNGTARLFIDGGGFVCTNSGVNFRFGFNAFGNSTQGGLDSMATNQVDVNGLLDLPGDSTITMGRSAAWSELNLLTNGDIRVSLIRNSEIAANNCPSQINFNGGTLRANTNSASFIFGVNNIYVLDGGVTIDSAGWDVAIGKALQQWPMGSTGGLTKIGAGTLTLNGADTYTGTRAVNQGKLILTTASTGGGAISVADAGSLGVTVAAQSATINAANITLGTTASHNGNLDIDLGGYALDLVTAPLTTSGTLAAAGTNTINITATNGLYLGQYPLIKYSGSLAGGVFNTFKLGTLPPLTGAVLVNNTGNQSVDINVTTGTLPPIQWYGWVDNIWDIGTSNWLDPNSFTQLQYYEVDGSGPKVLFTDTTTSYSVNVATTVKPYIVDVNASGDYTIGGAAPIAGSGTLTKSGIGALTLTSSNSYSGGSTLSQGTLKVGANGALGSGLLTLSGGVLSSDGVLGRTNSLAGVKVTTATTLGDGINTGPLNLNGTVDWNNGNRALTVASDVVFSGGSTNGRFSKVGTGVLTLQGVHSFNDVLNVFQGDVVLDGATLATANGILRPNCNQPFGLARVVMTNGATWTGTASIRVGFNQDMTATNILDLAGTMSSTGNTILGTMCALGEVNLLNGGVLQTTYVTSGDSTNFNGESRLNFNGGTLRAAGNSLSFVTGLTNAFVLNGGAIIDSAGFNITIGQPLLLGGTGGLTKMGTGTLTLDGVNTYTNTTLVSAGTLAGTGTIAGPVSVGASGTLAPGSSIGTLTINNNLSLAGSVLAEVSLDGGATNNDQVIGLSSVAYGGTLVITNVGATPLTAGVQFPLFSAAAPGTGAFSSITVLPATGLGGTLDAASGIVTLVSAAVPPTLTYTNLGSSLQFSWTGGGTLQVQTNALSAGLKTNWVDYPGSSPVTVPVNKTNPTVFFRVKQ